MELFGDDWLRENQRFANMPLVDRPISYRIATEPQFLGFLDEVKHMVSILSPDEKNKIIPRLHSNEHFEETRCELFVGHELHKMGFKVAYEKVFEQNQLTPDWFVTGKDGIPPFIVEVFTKQPSRQSTAANYQMNDLIRRLSRIPQDVAISIDLNIGHSIAELNQQRNKQLAHSVELWLGSQDIEVGMVLDLSVFTCRVVLLKRGYTSLQIVGPSFAFAVNNAPLRQTIEDKVGKYRVLVKELNLPLVVGVLADPLTGLDLEELVNILKGQEVYIFDWENPANSQTARQDDGLFPGLPELSAVFWIQYWPATGGLKIGVLENPKANLQLPPNTFSK